MSAAERVNYTLLVKTSEGDLVQGTVFWDEDPATKIGERFWVEVEPEGWLQKQYQAQKQDVEGELVAVLKAQRFAHGHPAIYDVPVDAGPDSRIVVYGDGEMGWYAWQLRRGGQVVQDDPDAGYGSPEVALRDALIEVYGMPQQQELDALMQRGQQTRNVAFR